MDDIEFLEIGICVLAPDDAVVRQLEEKLDIYDLGVDFLASSWENLTVHLSSTAPQDELVIVFVSLEELCSRGLEAVLEADVFFKSQENLRPILLVEPSVEDEKESLRLMTGFTRALDVQESTRSSETGTKCAGTSKSTSNSNPRRSTKRKLRNTFDRN